MPDSALRLFVFGLGYSALAFVESIRGRAASVSGTVRGEAKAAELAGRGIEALVFDGASPGRNVAAALAQATHLLVSVPPGEADDPVLGHHAKAIRSAPSLVALAYLSTIGVYGDYGGAWVDERTVPHPGPGRASHRIAAEKAWRKLAAVRGVPLAVHRIAGIYGPGRNPFVQLAEGRAHRVVKPGQVFNRIHVDDIAAVLAAGLGRDGTFNLADDEPAPPQDVIAYAAGLMGVAPPPETRFEEADLSPMARTFYEGNRRVANRRLKAELGVRLRYPTYREGLAALWQDGTWRG